MKWLALRAFFARRRPTLAERFSLRFPGSQREGSNAPLLVVSHDAHLAGAQRLLLDLLGQWRATRRFPVQVVSVGGGVLRDEFARLYPTLVLADYPTERARDDALFDFIRERPRVVFSNTVVNGPLLAKLRGLGTPILTHCHELQAAIERWASGSIMTETLTNSDYWIGASATIAKNLETRHQVPSARLAVVYAFIDYWESQAAPDASERARMRREFGLADDECVVLGCGTTDWRKGVDLFVQVAITACAQHSRLKFIWIGGEASPPQFGAALRAANVSDRVAFIGQRLDARRLFYMGDLFALTSREDPCALVALEAANAQLPVVCFQGAGDIPLVLGNQCGAVVPFENTNAFAAELLRLASNADERARAGKNGRERIRTHHSAASAAESIESTIRKALALPYKPLGRTHDSPLVSVIVPNYNHRRFLKRRLDSIATQTLGDIEIIVLDDASTDDSLELLQAFIAKDPRATLVTNDANSGSTFKQWRKGLALARGKYVWIAESDDFADRTLLARTVASLELDSSIVVAHAQSLMVDIDNKRLGPPAAWLDELALGRWNSDFVVDGIKEIRGFLSQKNTILNASAVVFRNFNGVEELVDTTMRLCADWLFWIRLLARGRYAFLAEPLNFWRQQSSNARTQPPGILEWQEGRRVLEQVRSILCLDEAEYARLLGEFRKRCSEWSGGLLDREAVF